MTNEQTEKYKEELMQFYEIQKKNSPPEEQHNESGTSSEENKYPEPELPDYIRSLNISDKHEEPGLSENEINNNDISEAADNQSYGNDIPEYGNGIIRAEVSTGNGALPVEDAFVVITRSVNGRKELIAALLTNRSGETVSVNIPAPEAKISDSIPFATVDIETSKNGFQTTVNRNVPVYSGITSIQPVNLIPSPAGNIDTEADII